MKIMFWKTKKLDRRLDEIAEEASSVHSENLETIRRARIPMENLNVALEQNNIIFRLAHVTGAHKK